MRPEMRSEMRPEMRPEPPPVQLTFVQLGLHAELQVLAAVFRVDDAVEGSGHPALEPE